MCRGILPVNAMGEAQAILEQLALEKQQRLLERLGRLESLLVALSGGADSAYLALGARMLAVTALSASFSAYDREQVEQLVAALGLPHEFIETRELTNPAYVANRGDRCYHC